MRVFNRVIGSVILAALVTSSYAQPRLFQAPLDNSNWETKSHRLYCEMWHQIPDYGKVHFLQEAGNPEQAELRIWYHRGVLKNRATLDFISPNWHAEQQEQTGWKFQVKTPNTPISFSARQARRILDALDQGYIPTITHRDNAYRMREIQAKISVVGFNPAYSQYAECQANLVPVTFSDLHRSNVFFDEASAKLSRHTKEWLDYVVAYAMEPEIRRVELGGYTDSIGSFRANHKLASLRVEAVRNYLVNSGVSPEIISVRVYGEQRPLEKNLSKWGRGQNRRVELKMWQ